MNEKQALLNEAVMVVGILNEAYYEQIRDDEFFPLTLHVCGIEYFAIELWGEMIWCSTSDKRDSIDDDGDAEIFEPLMEYIVRVASEKTKLFQKVDFSVMVDGNND